MDDVQLKRPFEWGLLLLLDREAPEGPQLTDAVVSASPSALGVKVLHAQDVDLGGFEPGDVVPPAEVRVRIHVGDRPTSETLFSGSIDIPSGVLIVGDAEHEEALEVGPGRWSVQVDCSPADFAEDVQVWLQAL
jgi:hypothetical protein